MVVWVFVSMIVTQPGETVYVSQAADSFDLLGKWKLPSRHILEQELTTCSDLLKVGFQSLLTMINDHHAHLGA